MKLSWKIYAIAAASGAPTAADLYAFVPADPYLRRSIALRAMRRPRSLLFPSTGSLMRSTRPSRFFRDLEPFFGDIDDFFPFDPEPFGRTADLAIADRVRSSRPAFQVREDEEKVEIVADLPGVKEEDVEVRLETDGRAVRMSGVSRTERGGMEIESKFDRTFLLGHGGGFRADGITTSLSDGVLTVTALKDSDVKDEKIIAEGGSEASSAVDDNMKVEGAEEEIKVPGGDGVAKEETLPQQQKSLSSPTKSLLDKPSIFQDMDNIFEETFGEMDKVFGGPGFPRPTRNFLQRAAPKFGSIGLGDLRSTLKVDEDEEKVQINVELPGVKAEDINVQLENNGNVLRLSGTSKTEKDGKEIESKFERAFGLSRYDFDDEQVTASLSDGALAITLPKINKSENPRKIAIVQKPSSAFTEEPEAEKVGKTDEAGNDTIDLDASKTSEFESES